MLKTNNNNNKDLYIFKQKINQETNNNNKLTNFSKVGKVYYNPSYSKEWKNSIYSFNTKNLIISTLNLGIINRLVKEYFNLFFNKNFLKNNKNIRAIKRFRGESLYKIYVSNVEIKHTNSKSLITVYVFDKDKNIMLSYIKKKLYILSSFFKVIFSIYLILKKECNNINIVNQLNKIITIYLQKNLKNVIGLIRRYKLRNNLNKYKFEENFLAKLGLLFSKLFNKKVEFSVIKVTSLKHNPDMFTYNLGMRYRRPKFNVVSVLGKAFARMVFPFEQEIDRNPKLNLKEFVDLTLLKNKFNDLHLMHTLNLNEFFDRKLSELYSLVNSKDKFKSTLDYIKYKKIRGIKVMANGRLTLRYRADRAQHKILIDGGLRNIDSSFKGLKTPMYRGNTNVNTEYSLYNSKRRIGSYAVKGWISYL